MTAAARNQLPSELSRIGVVIPANNEQDLLPACLDALRIAARRVQVPVTVVVVLDACTDGSAGAVDAAARRDSRLVLDAVVIEENNVGAARRAGMQTLLDTNRPEGLWLATTDADSVVPPTWLGAQLAHLAAGAGVVAGTITVADWDGHSQAVRDQATEQYTAGQHRHVHGANLSFAAQAYLAAGGFSPLPCEEDVALVAAFAAAGQPITWAPDLPVTTSARRQARAPGGFADYLNGLDPRRPASRRGSRVRGQELGPHRCAV